MDTSWRESVLIGTTDRYDVPSTRGAGSSVTDIGDGGAVWKEPLEEGEEVDGGEPGENILRDAL